MFKHTLFEFCAINLAKLIQNHQVAARCFHTSIVYNANIGKTMKKVLGNSGKKRRFVESSAMPTPASFSKGVNEGRGSGSSKRGAVLNKLFMRHITDLMATGQNCNEFLGHGIEINRVRITPDFRGLHVHWLARGDQNDEYVEAILNKNAGYLRSELSGMRVMGVVPKITFMKDKQYSQIIEVDNRLAKADFGDDHEPVQLATKLKTEFELFTPLDPSIREKVENLNMEEEGEMYEEPLPPMAQDVLGLNHQEILNRVIKVMNKSKALHRQSSCDSDLNHSINEDPIQYESATKLREAFKEFLEKRELQRRKAYKENKNYSPDAEYLKEQQVELHEQHYKNLEVYYDNFDSDEGDYLEEEDLK